MSCSLCAWQIWSLIISIHTTQHQESTKLSCQNLLHKEYRAFSFFSPAIGSCPYQVFHICYIIQDCKSLFSNTTSFLFNNQNIALIWNYYQISRQASWHFKLPYFLHLTLMCIILMAFRYNRREYLLDVTEIFNTLNQEKKKRLFKLGYIIILLCLSLFWYELAFKLVIVSHLLSVAYWGYITYHFWVCFAGCYCLRWTTNK